ncbi:UDP-2,3-diacylglucosamine diphosphatase [Arhodomonas sp. AD133]|uniref:UDP-2,3-diacylglucosamine diphosphatase n=1 Tax=Arhodomonas sp. AD133 TaxID=3415009 RepID=UPI003EB82154
MPHQHDSHSAPVLFISDLHLDPERPRITRLFMEFLAGEARGAGALYILGDLFEAWIGDDAVPPDHPVLQAMHALADAGVPLWVMRGNRDFLLGEGFAQATGAQMLPDPTTIVIDGEPVLLSHGDALCTDDHDYQRFRATVRDPKWQENFLALSVEERKAYAAQARTESSERNLSIDDYLMDVNTDEVTAVMRHHAVHRLIHGHTHRPAVHEFQLDGTPAQRIVLGDWYEQGSVLRCRCGRYELSGLPLT